MRGVGEDEEGRTVGEEFAEHEGMIGFGVVFWQADVFVHVKCDDMFETVIFQCQLETQLDRRSHVRKLALLHQGDKMLIRGDR